MSDVETYDPEREIMAFATAIPVTRCRWCGGAREAVAKISGKSYGASATITGWCKKCNKNEKANWAL